MSLMQGAWWVWPMALGLYLVFHVWYQGWRAALTREEIDHFLAKAEHSSGAEHSEPAALRAFLEQDDGREFLMINMIRLKSGPVPHPVTGVMTAPRDLLMLYFRTFLTLMLRKAGHPVLVSRKIAGYLDAWGAHPDEHWSLAGVVRYRSRRDFLELATHPRFMAAHPFKVAAMDRTYSFPAHPVSATVIRPRGLVALLLLWAAALVHLGSLLMSH
jgi:hypothetical protein